MNFLETCVLDADHKALEEHLKTCPVKQSDLDRCLFRGLRIVQQKKRELSHVAPALTLLLQFGAKWNHNDLLDNEQTPLHIMCDSRGDHHKLLDLIIKSSQGMICTSDIYGYSALLYAERNNNVNCIKKLIEKGALLGISDCFLRNQWVAIASMGNVELLKHMFNHGIDKDRKDEDGFSVLWFVVESGNVEAIHYLLDLGVAIPTYKSNVRETQCKRCKEKMLKVNDREWQRHEIEDLCMRVIYRNKLEIVTMLDEYGSQTCKSFNALRNAVIGGCVDVVSYLLNKYTYPLNIEYIPCPHPSRMEGFTLLTELNLGWVKRSNVIQITKLLLDHGADPAKPMCVNGSANATMTAIHAELYKVMIQYIRSGVDINIRSYDRMHGYVLPFEASVLHCYFTVAEILLISGCSCGVFSLDNHHMFKNNLTPEVEKLMKDWKMQENNVTPLKQRCRSVILNHLSLRADEKIEKLPLPKCLIKFLGIPELDVIVDRVAE